MLAFRGELGILLLISLNSYFIISSRIFFQEGPQLECLSRDREMNGSRVLSLDAGSLSSTPSRSVTHARGDGGDFIAWVESHSNSPTAATPAPATPLVGPPPADDTDSVKSSYFYFFGFQFYVVLNLYFSCFLTRIESELGAWKRRKC